LSGVQVDNSPAVATRSLDISSWKEEDISALTSSEKKRYYRRKSALKDYFTTEETLDQIALRYHLATKMLEKLAKRCFMQHEDGAPWGFRALVPGVTVVDYTPTPGPEPAPVADVICDNAGADAIPEAVGADAILDNEGTDTIHDNAGANALPDDVMSADDKEDTAPRPAIVLSQQNPVLADDMPDVIGIEETRAGDGENGVEEKVGDADETQEETSADEDPVSSLSDLGEIREDVVGSLPEEVLPEDDVLAVSERQVQPAVVESAVDMMDVAAEARTPLPDVLQGDSGAFYVRELADSVSRSLVVRERMLLAALPRTSKKHAAITDKKMIIAQRSIRRRWVRSVERTHTRRTYRLIGAVVAAVLFLSLLIPVGAGIAAYSAYNSIKSIALDSVNHLMDVKTLLPVSKSDPTAVLNPAKLQLANADFMQAESDFLQLQQLVNRQDIQSLVQQFAPQYSNKLGMAQRLVQVGIDVTRMGSEFINIAMLGATILHGSPLASGSTKPLITVNDVSNIEGTLLHALYYIQDIKTQMSQVSLSQLPINATQQKEIASAMTLLPKAQSYIEQGQGVIGIVSWLLGVGQARRFLVQTMDRAELRPSGGFTGQYGVFSIQDGRMAPFTLQDVTELDYNGNGAELGRQAPPGYTSWMNFGNFGLRDANLSGDFPTTARIAMQVFQDEGGGPVDGDIMFTPTVIEHVLEIVGPIKISEYNDTITAQNLEDKLHYYQNDPAAIALQKAKTNTNNAASRKSFTALVGKKLLETVRGLPIKTLMKVVQNAVKDIQARDLEIYFSNPQAEAWLVAHSYSGAMSTFSNADGFMVVQSNISISKASQDVQTTEQDTITLDAQGGATHNLTITLDYRGTKPIYSVYTTYADYIRVYAPANAVLQGGYGFDTGKALCTPNGTGTTTGTGGPVKRPPPPNSLPPCSQFTKTYSSNALYCPSGNYDMGQRGWVPGKGFSNWAVEALGAPIELTSDLPGRAMWGGLTVTPKNCISTISLSWYVPNAVKHVVGQPLYAVLAQKQGGYVPVVQINIDTSQLNGVKPYSFNGNIYGDRLFSLAVVKKGH
jgi:hypothetical protein